MEAYTKKLWVKILEPKSETANNLSENIHQEYLRLGEFLDMELHRLEESLQLRDTLNPDSSFPGRRPQRTKVGRDVNGGGGSIIKRLGGFYWVWIF